MMTDIEIQKAENEVTRVRITLEDKEGNERAYLTLNSSNDDDKDFFLRVSNAVYTRNMRARV